jgi:hypothetical protein
MLYWIDGCSRMDSLGCFRVLTVVVVVVCRLAVSVSGYDELLVVV